MTEHHIYYVDAAHEDVRLDTFLTAHLPAHSRSRIKALIETGHVTVDRGTAKPALHLRRGQRVEVVVPPPPPPRWRLKISPFLSCSRMNTCWSSTSLQPSPSILAPGGRQARW